MNFTMNLIKKYTWIGSVVLLGMIVSIPVAFAKENEDAQEYRKDLVTQGVVSSESRDDQDDSQMEEKDSDIKNDSSKGDDDKDDISNDRNDDKKVDSQDQDSDDDNTSLNGETHRSTVATFVQGLLTVADKQKTEIGQQIKVVAQEQEKTKDVVAEKIDTIKNRSNLKTFFIGTDYKNIGQLRSEIVTTNNQINQLKTLLEKVSDTASKTEIQKQIQLIEQEKATIEAFLKTNETKFSLFGWLAKMFNK